eukprot:3431770-Amphidinium_carterae.1
MEQNARSLSQSKSISAYNLLTLAFPETPCMLDDYRLAANHVCYERGHLALNGNIPSSSVAPKACTYHLVNVEH